VNKKSILIIGLFLSIGLISYPSFANGFPCNLIFFDTDKDTYYTDESIKIDATWNLDDNSSYDFLFIQIQLFNASNHLLWNSSKYNQTGNNSDVWFVDIQGLNIIFTNYSNSFYVKFYLYLYSSATGGFGQFLQTIQILTIKRNISCELIGFTDHLNYGEDLYFKARFYNTSSNNNFYLINHLISLTITTDKFILYKSNYTTNSSGIIEILIASYTNLTIGLNVIIFMISSDKFFKESFFEFELFVESPTHQEPNSKKSKNTENSLQVILISFISIFSFMLVISLVIYYNKTKRVRHKNLSDITFKY